MFRTYTPIQTRDEFARIPLKIKFDKNITFAQLYDQIGDYVEAENYIKQAQVVLDKLTKHYKLISTDYYFLDQIDQLKNTNLSVFASIYNHLDQFDKARKKYYTLIDMYEKYRDTLPKELKKSFFQGYSKDAYLGLIILEAKNHMASKKSIDFEALLNSIDLFTSREFKELTDNDNQIYISVDDIQNKLAKKSAILSTIEVPMGIVFISITKKNYDVKILKHNDLLSNINAMLKQEQPFNYKTYKAFSKWFLNGINLDKNIENVSVLNRGKLATIPLEAIQLDTDKFFGEKYTVSYLNLLQVPNKTKSKFNNFLGVADPLYNNNKSIVSNSDSILQYFTQLPETADEVKDISKLFKTSKLLLRDHCITTITPIPSLNSNF